MLNCFRNIPLYMRASFLTSCTALLFGMDTGTIGPVTTMLAFKVSMGELSSTMHGVVVSSILLTGALSSLFAGVFADKYGRTRIIAIGSVVFGIGAAIECGALHLAVFITGRMIKGFGEGLFLSTIYVQVCEISPARIRGTMSSLPQFMIVIGLVSGYFICYGTGRITNSSASWRLPGAIQTILSLGFAAICALVPPSPRWLLAKGKVDQARVVISQLGIDENEQRELLAQSSSALEHSPDSSLIQNLQQTLKDFGEAFAPPFWSRTAFGCFIMAMQQFSGIDGVLYYAPLIFQQAGLSSEEASFLASGISGLLILAVTIPATLFADRWGRRTSSLAGGCTIGLLMLLIGSLYVAKEVHPDSGAGRWVVIVSIYLFAMAFSGTWAIGFRAFLVESLPRKTRSSAASLGQSANWIANYIVALTTPVFIANTTFGAYYFFAACTLFCTLCCAIFMHETKGHSLENIEERFSRRASRAKGRWPVDGFRLRTVRVRE